jgi:carbon storage regulator
MLVVTRRVDEGIRIGKDVIVRIVEIDGSKVKIGIEAPPNVKVLRLELDEYEEE